MKTLATAIRERLPRLAQAVEVLTGFAAVAPPGSPPIATETPSPEMGQHAAYAHWGEDLIVSYLLNEKKNGFYVDVGCFHPTLYSNTKLLFDAGWSGVNIDPNPFMIEQFRQARPNDVNLNLAVSDVSGNEIDFFIFNDWGSSNTASPEFAAQVSKHQNVSAKKIRVVCETLGNIFERHCANRKIDFLNVDVEALDLKVLQSSDWETWRPAVVAIEDFKFDFAAPTSSAIFNFLISKRYQMVSRCVYTSIFVAEESGIRL